MLNIAGFPILSHEFRQSFSILSHNISTIVRLVFIFFEKLYILKHLQILPIN
jgi:hypothetical protein